MASTSETGHSKNVSNFGTMISYCTGNGVTYNPAAATMVTVGGTVSTIGTGLELVNDAFEGKFSFAKFIRKAIIETVSRKIGGSSTFGPTEQIVNDNIFNMTDKGLDELDK